MNETLNLTMNETVNGAGEMALSGAQAAQEGWLPALTGVLNAVLGALKVQFSFSPEQVGLILMAASLVLFWWKAKAVLEILKQYGTVVIILVAIYVLVGPVLHLI
ncbi:MAG: hypothetical protein WC350_05870 [Candidatus Micrarchaeia archaeon]|jgi:hypothetical protein